MTYIRCFSLHLTLIDERLIWCHWRAIGKEDKYRLRSVKTYAKSIQASCIYCVSFSDSCLRAFAVHRRVNTTYGKCLGSGGSLIFPMRTQRLRAVEYSKLLSVYLVVPWIFCDTMGLPFVVRTWPIRGISQPNIFWAMVSIYQLISFVI